MTRVAAVAAALALLLVGCGGEDEPEPDPVAVTPTPTASPSPSPTPSPTPAGPFAPLTGEPVAEDVARRPALVAKVENTPAARPQAGLEVADLVIEELVEGGVTRWFAVFHSRIPGEVGPIRSARLVDAALLPWLDAVLLYSGARPDVEAAIAPVAARRVTEGATGVYRASGRRAPHNLFADAAAAFDAVDTTDLGPPASAFVFSDAAPPRPAAAAGTFTVEMSNRYRTGWTWDPDAGVYRRDQNGTPQPTVSGVPIGAASVVVLGVPVGPGGCCDTSGSRYVATTTTGTGRAIVLRDGSWFEATWTRPDVGDPVELTRDGLPLPLAPGPVWMHLAPAENLPPDPAEDLPPEPTP